MGKCLVGLIVRLEKSLEAITAPQFGIKVNKKKQRSLSSTNKMLIHRRLDSMEIRFKNACHVLVVQFDAKPQWSQHIFSAIVKANRAPNTMHMLRKSFSTLEMLRLVEPNFYSILFYNSEGWQILTLKFLFKQYVLLAS
jgi:hypothetical protein